MRIMVQMKDADSGHTDQMWHCWTESSFQHVGFVVSDSGAVSCAQCSILGSIVDPV